MKPRDMSLCLLIMLLAGSYAQDKYFGMLEEMYIKLNRFRIDLDHLQTYTEDEFALRVYD